MKKIRVLFTPAGSGLAIAAINALKNDDSIEVYAADSSKLAPGLYLADHKFIVPKFDSGFYGKIQEIVTKNKIDVLVPCLDTILLDFANKCNEFAKLGCKVLISPSETINICRDKWLTYKKLNKYLPFPKSFIYKENIQIDLPIIIKPRMGSGSIGFNILNSKEELEFFFPRTEDPIIQEYLPGKEYTIDCLASQNGELIFCLPRERIVTKSGICTKGKIIKNVLLDKMAKQICEKLKLKGPFFFQAKNDKDENPKIMEINPRISGTMSLTNYESNIYSIAIRECIGKEFQLPEIKYETYMIRFWQEIFLSKQEVEK